MRLLNYKRFCSWIICLLLAAWARNTVAQTRYMPRYVEPRWFTFRLSQVSAGVYADATYQSSDFDNSEVSVSYTRTFIGPSLGLVGRGSVYHPNLLSYTLITDGAVGWAHDDVSGSESSSTDEVQFLGSLAWSMDLLSGKPYNGGAFVNYDHTYRDNDFYSRILVNSLRYGARANWQHEKWSLFSSYAHRDEESSSRYPVRFVPGGPGVLLTTDYDQITTTVEDTATVGGRHTRNRGETGLDYIFNRYTRTDFGQIGKGTDHTISLSDVERLGDRDQYRLATSASYALREQTFADSEEFLANAGFSAEHRPNLNSYYDFAYDRFEQGPFNSDAFTAQASVNHRLYESLNSSLFLRGSDYETSDAINDGYTRRYGGGFSEEYTKRLSEEHRLRLAASAFLEHTDQQNIGTVVNERHAILPAGEPGAPSPFSFILNQPNVDPLSIVVTDERDAPPFFVPGFDYAVSVLGSRTVITWLRPPGPGTPTTVLVDYSSEPLPPGSYETLTQSYLVRFELWKNLLGLYGRVTLSQNNAPEELRVQEFINYAFGTDFSWKGLRAGAEYQVYDSTESDYRTVRLYQSYGFRPDQYSSLTLDFNEMWIDYIDSGREEQDYRFIARYYRTLTRRLGFTFEAGTAYRTSDDFDQLLATVRPAIKYMIGRTTIDAGYFYQYELFLNQEERHKHMLQVRLKRVF